MRRRSFVPFFGLLSLALPLSVTAEVFELSNGDTLDATVIEETKDTIVVEHPQLGRVVLQRSALKPPALPNPGLFGTWLLEGWRRNIGVGFSGSSGNSSDASVTGPSAHASQLLNTTKCQTDLLKPKT